MQEPESASYSAGVSASEKGNMQQVSDAIRYSRGERARDSSKAGVAYPAEARVQAAAAAALRAAAARRAAACAEHRALGADGGDDGKTAYADAEEEKEEDGQGGSDWPPG